MSVTPAEELTLTPLHRVRKTDDFEISLDGEWSLAHTDPDADAPPDQSWLKADVPGFVQWQLFQAGEIPHPYRGLNSRDLRWIEERAWWYRRSFRVPDAWAGKRLMLTFDGLDYYAQIFVNGKLLAHHEGAFGGPDIDITADVQAGDNELVIRLTGGGAHKGKPPRNGSGTIVKSETFGRWMNNPDLMTIGIWRSVRLQALSDATLERPFLRTLRCDSDSARLQLEVEIAESGWIPALQDLWGMTGVYSVDAGWQWRNLLLEQPVSLAMRIRFGEGPNAITIEKPVTMDHRRQWERVEFDVPRPALWWPIGMGPQPLHAVSVELLSGDRVIDATTFRYGIRTIEMTPSPTRKKQDRWANWQMRLNGRPLFVKGCNMMPLDLLNLTADRYRWFLALARGAGIQMLRVNGCGLLEADVFYQLCDELGILVYQEYPINCRWTCQEIKLDIFESQAIRNVQRLRNHPSLAIWSGGNEFPVYDARNAAAVGIMERTVRDFDPDRAFFRASPDAGDQHAYPEQDTTWFIRTLGDRPAITEWGGHTMPSMELLREILPADELNRTPVALTELDADAFEKQHPTLLHHWTEFNVHRFPPAMRRASIHDDLPHCTMADFCEAIQVGSAETYETVARAFRSNHPMTTLIMPWNLNRPWPTVAMQLIDHTGRTLPGYHALKRAYAPICPAIILPFENFAPGESAGIDVRVICEDVLPRVGWAMRVRVLDHRLKTIAQEHYADAVGDWLETRSFPMTVTAPHAESEACFFVVADVIDANREVIARAVQWPRALQSFVDESVRADYRRRPNTALHFKHGPWLRKQVAALPTRLKISGARCLAALPEFRAGAKAVAFEISNIGSTPAVMVRVRGESQDQLANPSDDHFWLDAGETRTLSLVMIDAGRVGPFSVSADLAAEYITICVDAWNADCVSVNHSLDGGSNA